MSCSTGHCSSIYFFSYGYANLVLLFEVYQVFASCGESSKVVVKKFAFIWASLVFYSLAISLPSSLFQQTRPSQFQWQFSISYEACIRSLAQTLMKPNCSWNDLWLSFQLLLKTFCSWQYVLHLVYFFNPDLNLHLGGKYPLFWFLTMHSSLDNIWSPYDH